MDKINTATRGAAPAERKRIPMAVPVAKLEAPEIPGFHLHWFNGTPERIQRALEGGYEYVYDRDIQLNATQLGGDSTVSGNTDMGSQVSRVAGTELGRDGQPIRMILMKIKQEWYDEDQKLVEARNDAVADALTGGMIGALQGNTGETQTDAAQRYVDKSKTKIPDFFKKRKPQRAAS